MNRFIVILLFFAAGSSAYANVYVIIYATKDGRTGHAGIALDNYRIIIEGDRRDTVADGTLTYFDLWPDKDHFGLRSLSQDCPARYYKLPNAIWSSSITVLSLYSKGLPHREHSPCDAILMIDTSPSSDYALEKKLDEALNDNAPYNPRHHNCSDFVISALRPIIKHPLHAREFMPFTFTTTPNKLCRKLMKQHGVTVIKSPGKKINGQFVQQRIMKKKPVYNPFTS